MPGVAGQLTLTIGLLVVGCGVIDGITLPAPGDISGIRRPASPNTCVAGPPESVPPPDVSTRIYELPPDQLFAAVQQAVMAQPRTTALALDTGRLRADYVVRSRVFRFPDIVLTQVLRVSDGQSALVLYSYSLKGYYDFGVNRSRVAAILAALDTALVEHR